MKDWIQSQFFWLVGNFLVFQSYLHDKFLNWSLVSLLLNRLPSSFYKCQVQGVLHIPWLSENIVSKLSMRKGLQSEKKQTNKRAVEVQILQCTGCRPTAFFKGITGCVAWKLAHINTLNSGALQNLVLTSFFIWESLNFTFFLESSLALHLRQVDITSFSSNTYFHFRCQL